MNMKMIINMKMKRGVWGEKQTAKNDLLKPLFQ